MYLVTFLIGFHSLSPIYIRGSAIVMVVYDITNVVERMIASPLTDFRNHFRAQKTG
jgi:hypothetical protein